MEGNSKGWFPNGQLQFDYNFRNNQEHGICTEWDIDGRKISELQFTDGAPVQNLLTGKRIQSEKDNTSGSLIDNQFKNTTEITPERSNLPNAQSFPNETDEFVPLTPTITNDPVKSGATTKDLETMDDAKSPQIDAPNPPSNITPSSTSGTSIPHSISSSS